MLEGRVCRLRPLRREDVGVLSKIMNDIEVKETLRNVLPVGESSLESMIESIYKCPYPTNIVFGIEHDGRLVGVVSLDNINWVSRNAYLSIGIYDKSVWGRGIGKEATKLILKYAFEYLNIHKVNLEVYEYNERAIRLYESLGFVQEGRLRKNNYRHGSYHDVIIMGMLDREYFELSKNW